MKPRLPELLHTGLTVLVGKLPAWLRNTVQAKVRLVTARTIEFIRRAKGMLRIPSPASMRKLHPVTGIILAFGGIAAIGGYFAIHDYGIAPVQRERDRVANEVSSIVTKSIDRQIAIAESAGALFSGSGAKVTRWTFFKHARALPSKNPGLTALEWIPRVMGRQRRTFEKKARADGLFDFQFVDRTEDGRRIKAARRSVYFPVYYVEPYAGNEATLGLDLAANGKLGALLAQVPDTGKTAVIPSSMSGEGNISPGFSVIVPVYRSGTVPFTVAERRKSLSGFVRASFRFDRLVRSLHAGVAGLPALEVYIVDRTDGKNLPLIHFFTSHDDRQNLSAGTIDASRGTFYSVDHEVAGRRWTILVKPVRSLFLGIIGLAPWGFVALVLIVTSLLLRHIAAMRVARERAEAANRAKSEFLAMMSHELRTPLNSVIGFSDMMINEIFGPVSNEHYKQYTQHINRSATHLLGLINTILDLSKVEAGYYTLEKQYFSVGEIWDAVFSMLQGTVRDSGVEVDDNLSGSALTLHADPTVFRQILHNLLSNAVKFTGQGGRVEVTADGTPDGRFTLRVTDTGIGIARENLDLVLLPFRQVDNSLSRNYEGIGLGLPLTRKLVEIQGGELLINSELGKGTEVTVNFPGNIIAAEEAPVHAPSDDKSVDHSAEVNEKKALASAR